MPSPTNWLYSPPLYFYPRVFIYATQGRNEVEKYRGGRTARECGLRYEYRADLKSPLIWRPRKRIRNCVARWSNIFSGNTHSQTRAHPPAFYSSDHFSPHPRGRQVHSEEKISPGERGNTRIGSTQRQRVCIHSYLRKRAGSVFFRGSCRARERASRSTPLTTGNLTWRTCSPSRGSVYTTLHLRENLWKSTQKEKKKRSCHFNPL